MYKLENWPAFGLQKIDVFQSSAVQTNFTGWFVSIRMDPIQLNWFGNKSRNINL